MILFISILSLIPFFIISGVSYYWLSNILKEDVSNQVKWQIESTRNSIEYFVDIKISTFKFITTKYDFSELSDQANLSKIFREIKEEFSDLVDLGLVDSGGIQKSYIGPYNLSGHDYSKEHWFHEVVVRGFYVSNVFIGDRQIPHFTIALKRDLPADGAFWILRAAIDMDTLNRFIAAIKLKENDDAFIIDHKGTLQTPSRFYGDVLKQYTQNIPLMQQGISMIEIETEKRGDMYFGYTYIKNTPWILSVLFEPTINSKVFQVFHNELLAIFLGSIILVIIVAIRMANIMVGRIEEADHERADALSEIEHSNKLASIGRLAAGVAHEINNPLAIINQKAGLMRDIIEMSEDSQHFEKFLQLIEDILNTVDRCRTITHRLLGFARRMDMTYEVLDINDVIKEVLGFLEKEISMRSVHLTQQFSKALPEVRSDKGQLQQVFLNIINNAVDAVEDNGFITIKTYVKDKDTVIADISDNGKGITKSELKHIFDPFFTTKDKDKGTGLGLSISYGIMKKLGGTISVDSKVDKGTTFIIEIPIKHAIIKEGGNASD